MRQKSEHRTPHINATVTHSSPPRIYHCHRLLSPATTSTATVSNLIFRFHVCVHFSTPPLSIHLARFLHWLTSKTSRLWQPSTTASTPTPVTRTHPRTESSRSSSRCRPIALSDESDTADPQNDSFRTDRCGQPSERTSVAVSDKAQQKDCVSEISYSFEEEKERLRKGVRKALPNQGFGDLWPHS